MAEKVKVSRDVAKVLDEVRACHEPTIDLFIKEHANGEVDIDWKVLAQYRTAFVAHLIYTGDYEIDETPEEILLLYYQNAEKNRNDGIARKDVYSEAFGFGYMQGVKAVLNLKAIEIEGINK